MENTLLFIVLCPLLGALVNACWQADDVKRVGIVASAASLLSFVFSIVAVVQYGSQSIVQPIYQWLNVGRIHVQYSLEYNPIIAIMLMVVCGIGTLIHVYSIEYMKDEKKAWRFFSYLNLFLFAMLNLVLSSNLLGVFFGWEGVGLCSYLLIGYWYQDADNAKGGMKAFVVNRIGDLGFLLALFVLLSTVGSLEFADILNSHGQNAIPSWALLLVCASIFWASTGKSAQFPLYVWLPDAMAGPTPVSALIHAATMVTSGIFVCVRLWPLFASVPSVLEVIFWVGTLTAWLAALIAVTQSDVKKVLAYSTVSQLGFMFAALGAGAPVAALFHVVTHACFKALLFLGAGSVIAGMHHEQEMGLMGNLRAKMPKTHLTFAIGTAAIIGFPLITAGFYSKDMILLNAMDMGGGVLGFCFLLGAAFLTAFYMLRAYALCFWGKARSDQAKKAHENSWTMVAPLAILAFLSVVVGFFQTPHFLGGVTVFQQWVEASWHGLTVVGASTVHHSIGKELLYLLIISGGSLGIGYLSFKKYSNVTSLEANDSIWYQLSKNKFYIDEIYQRVFIKPLSWGARGVSSVVDNFCLDGLWHSFRKIYFVVGGTSSVAHTGSVQSYAWVFMLSTLLLVALFWWVVV